MDVPFFKKNSHLAVLHVQVETVLKKRSAEFTAGTVLVQGTKSATSAFLKKPPAAAKTTKPVDDKAKDTVVAIESKLRRLGWDTNTLRWTALENTTTGSSKGASLPIEETGEEILEEIVGATASDADEEIEEDFVDAEQSNPSPPTHTLSLLPHYHLVISNSFINIYELINA